VPSFVDLDARGPALIDVNRSLMRVSSISAASGRLSSTKLGGGPTRFPTQPPLTFVRAPNAR
jgi:hypothetical protein